MELDLLDNLELIALAKLDLENKQTDKALIKIKKALLSEENPADLSIFAGKVYAQLKLFDYAETHYRNYLEQHPNSLHERFELGMIMFDNEKIEPALELWNEILANDEGHPPSLFYSSIAYLQQSNADIAKTRLQKLVELVPSSNLYYSKAMDELAHIKEQSGQTVSGVSTSSATH